MINPILIASLGPGDALLATLESSAALSGADAVFCPTVKGRSRSREVLTHLGVADTAIRPYELPMSKDRTAAHEVYDRVMEEAISLHLDGQNVVLVAEGDAGFYSSTSYLETRLQARRIAVKRLPGVPAFIAAASAAGIAVVEQGQRLTVCPEGVDEALIHRISAGTDVAVLMKLSQVEGQVKALMRTYPKLQWHYFENVATEEFFYSSQVEEVLARPFPYFSLLIIKC